MKENLCLVFAKNFLQPSPPLPPLSIIPHPECVFISRSPSLSSEQGHSVHHYHHHKKKKMSSPSPLMAVAMTTAINVTVLLRSTQNECLYRMFFCSRCPVLHLAWLPTDLYTRSHMGTGTSLHLGNDFCHEYSFPLLSW